MIFAQSVPVQCRVYEQIIMAYRTDIVQCDASFCDEKYRSWIDVEWNQLEVGEFSSDSDEASGCRFALTVGPCVRFGRWFRKHVEPGKVYCVVCRTELCYANREAVVFTRLSNSEAHQQKLGA